MGPATTALSTEIGVAELAMQGRASKYFDQKLKLVLTKRFLERVKRF